MTVPTRQPPSPAEVARRRSAAAADVQWARAVEAELRRRAGSASGGSAYGRVDVEIAPGDNFDWKVTVRVGGPGAHARDYADGIDSFDVAIPVAVEAYLVASGISRADAERAVRAAGEGGKP